MMTSEAASTRAAQHLPNLPISTQRSSPPARLIVCLLLNKTAECKMPFHIWRLCGCGHQSPYQLPAHGHPRHTVSRHTAAFTTLVWQCALIWVLQSERSRLTTPDAQFVLGQHVSPTAVAHLYSRAWQCQPCCVHATAKAAHTPTGTACSRWCFTTLDSKAW